MLEVVREIALKPFKALLYSFRLLLASYLSSSILVLHIQCHICASL